jgi:membrane-bound ClpP family serine protease
MPKERKGIPKPKRKLFYQEYNFEITVVLLIALGVFLLVEELEIKHYLYEFIKVIFFTIGNFIKFLRDTSIYIIDKFEISDLVGISLILLAIFLIANRWRERMIERYSVLKNCPDCNGDLQRIKRDFNQKMTGYIYFLTVKNYHCKSCNYTGFKLVKK